MLDVPEMLIIVLTALTVVVWTRGWILQRREDRGNQTEEVEDDPVQKLVG